MHCPRCQTSALDEREREGVTIDVCRSCRGIWLDRGELEKLIARATREMDEWEARPPDATGRRYGDDSPPGGFQHGAPRPPDAHGRRYGDDSPPGGWKHGKPHRKKRWYDVFGDIFD